MFSPIGGPSRLDREEWRALGVAALTAGVAAAAARLAEWGLDWIRDAVKKQPGESEDGPECK